MTYRSELELDERFGRRAQTGEDPLAGGRYAIESYLDHQADKLVGRFDANSYLVLSRAMDHHDLGRDRGGTAAALANVQAASTVGSGWTRTGSTLRGSNSNWRQCFRVDRRCKS